MEAKIVELISIGGVAVAVIFSLAFLFKTIGFKVKTNGNGGASLDHPLFRQGMEVVNKFTENSTKQTSILENLLEVEKTNGERLERLEGAISIAMERQKTTMATLDDIKKSK